MFVLEQMKDMLYPLGIYSLDDNSLVTCELKVYADEFEKLHERLNTLLSECFISTALSYGLEKAEELFTSPQKRYRPFLKTVVRNRLYFCV